MKKGIVYAFILSLVCMAASGFMRQYILTEIMFFLAVILGLATFYFIIRQSFLITSKAASNFKTESNKAYTSLKLFYQLETLRVSRGVKQLNAGEKKAKTLMRLIKKRFSENSLTSIRFRQEIESYAQQIIQNLEQVVCNKESLSSINPRHWQDQIWQLQKVRSAKSYMTIKELQQNLMSYENLGKQYRELLAENDQLLAQMDKAILALSQESYKVFADNSPTLLTGEDSFMNKFLYQ